MIYTGLLSLLLAEHAANQKCSAVLLCSADSIYPKVRSTLTFPIAAIVAVFNIGVGLDNFIVA